MKIILIGANGTIGEQVQKALAGAGHEIVKVGRKSGDFQVEIENREWVKANPKTPRAPWEIEAWSAYMEKRGPDSDAETLSGFAEYVGQHSKTREDINTWFDPLNLSHFVPFAYKPYPPP